MGEQRGAVCADCGAVAGVAGARDRHGRWHSEADMGGMKSDEGEDLFATPDGEQVGYPETRVASVRLRDRFGRRLCGPCFRAATKARDPTGYAAGLAGRRAKRRVERAAAVGQAALPLEGVAL